MARPTKPLKRVEGVLPIGLDHTDLINTCKEAGLSSDRILLFFKYILGGSRRYNDGYQNTEQYVEIHHTHPKKLFGLQDAAKYKAFMKAQGYIETKKHHHYTKTATKYRINPDLFVPKDIFGFKDGWTYRIKLTDRRAINANDIYLKFRRQQYIKTLNDPVYLPVIDSLKTLCFDTGSAWAEGLISTIKGSIYKDPYDFDETLRAIQSGENEYYLIDAFGRRFHSVWSSLNKVLRPLLYFQGQEGQKLIGLDIVNSQPWLTSIIDLKVVKQFVPEVAEEIAPILSRIRDTADWRTYKRLCTNGGIYERWIEVLRSHLGEDWRAQMAELDRKYKYKKGTDLSNPNLSDRDVAKVLFFRVIYGKQIGAMLASGRRRRLVGNFRVLNNTFRSEWPEVWDTFAQIKEVKFKANPSDKKGGHTNLSMIMQRIESAIMRQFVVEFLGLGISKFVPIYDGTLHLESDIDLAIETAYEVIQAYGLPTPKIDKENPEEKLNKRIEKERGRVL